ncbi:MAG: DNA-processing protein DprA [Deltaproteobacteria bacterium]|nr:DNA-processing protein DprA [Deltaproteobacteria bacterium]
MQPRTDRDPSATPADWATLAATGEAFDLAMTERLLLPDPLYAVGDLALLRGTRRVAVVGTREASVEGLARARRLARELAQAGVVVVSGLAAGIDGEAHRAAIAGGGRTIAVLGTPLDRNYPQEHRDLQAEIGRNHLLVSQFGRGVKVGAKGYLARNRTMALLSHASVIVECGDSSGTLSQAGETMRLGRTLFLLQSAMDRTDLAWPRRFAAKGAVVLHSVSQILEGLPC